MSFSRSTFQLTVLDVLVVASLSFALLALVDLVAGPINREVFGVAKDKEEHLAETDHSDLQIALEMASASLEQTRRGLVATEIDLIESRTMVGMVDAGLALELEERIIQREAVAEALEETVAELHATTTDLDTRRAEAEQEAGEQLATDREQRSRLRSLLAMTAGLLVVPVAWALRSATKAPANSPQNWLVDSTLASVVVVATALANLAGVATALACGVLAAVALVMVGRRHALA